MQQKKAIQVLQQLRQKYVAKRIVKNLIYALSFACFLAFFLHFFIAFSASQNVFFILLSATISILFLSFKQQLFSISLDDITFQLNKYFPQLENSTHLVLKKEKELNFLEQLQQQKILSTFPNLDTKKAFSISFKQPFLALFSSIIFIASASQILSFYEKKINILNKKNNINALKSTEKENFLDEKKEKPFLLEKVTIEIKPPAYTQKTNTYFKQFQDLQVPENSEVTFQIEANQSVEKASLQIDKEQLFSLKCDTKNTCEINHIFTENSLYHFAFFPPEKEAFYSDYFKVNVLKDMPADISFLKPQAYSEIDILVTKNIEIEAQISDDYGLENAFLMMTIAKGEGEAVKFEEQQLSFDRKQKVAKNQFIFRKTIDLKKYNIAPSDEIFLYITASDNKKPKPNISRSDVHIVEIADTSEQAIFEISTSPIDVMPAYFRSQRQLIIDTDKLIAEKTKLSTTEFAEKSNGLAKDQKLLRLRYGQFLGEEFESEAGGHHHEEHEHEHEKNDTTRHIHSETCNHEHEHHEDSEESHIHEEHEHEKNDTTTHKHSETCTHEHHEHEEDSIVHIGHNHDEKEHKHEHQEAEDAHAGHHHAEPEISPEAEDEIATNTRASAEFMHIHDVEGAANFFSEAIKTKLKKALAEMWEAELHLRMAEPEKALPFEHKALKIIKDIQQQSRIYVHKAGFETTPLEPYKKRFSGDLSDLKNLSNIEKNEAKEQYISSRKALAILQKIKNESYDLKAKEIVLFEAAGRELSAALLTQKGNYFAHLSHLRRFITFFESEKEICYDCVPFIEAALFHFLPKEKVKARFSSPKNLKEMTKVYYEELW